MESHAWKSREGWLRTLSEAAVIIASVLVALAADSWWERRSDRAEEASYLAALAVELDSLTVVIDNAIGRDSSVAARAERALRLLRHGVPTDAGADSLPPIAMSYSLFNPPTATLRLLAASDRSSLIESEELRGALVAAEGDLHRTERLLERTEEETWALGQRFGAEVERLWQAGGRAPSDGPLDMEAREVALPLSFQRASPELRAIYFHQQLVSLNRVSYLRRLGRRVAQIRTMVDEYR